MSFIKNISQIKQEHKVSKLSVEKMNSDPIAQFKIWFRDVLNYGIKEPCSMVLSTISPESIPYSRVVLLKGIDSNGFLFYTNYKSRKAQHIQYNPHVCLNFFWEKLQRQIHVWGEAVKSDSSISDDYFSKRPKGSQISVYASRQSEFLTEREKLDNSYEEFNRQFANIKSIQRPPYWGGYYVKPKAMEFWQERVNRLHDRVHYVLQADNCWKKRLLYP